MKEEQPKESSDTAGMLTPETWVSDNKPEEETEVEFILGELKNFRTLEMFTNIKSLTLQNQKITSLKTIVPCVKSSKLEELYLNENMIGNFEGVEAFPLLRKLVLDFNFIESMEDLPELKNLTYLSVSENKLKDLKNVPSTLKELRIAANLLKDSAIQDLKALTSLQVLNISCNLISNISTVHELSNFRGLKVLFLNDVNYGPNPVCLLNNYEIFVKSKLTHLDEIDGETFDSEEKEQKAEVFFKYKQFYQNRTKYYHSLTKTLSNYINSFVSFYEIYKFKQIMFFSKRNKMLDFIEVSY